LVFSLGLIVAILFLNAVLDYRNTRELKEDVDWVTHFRAVQESLDAVLLTIVDAETGQRGFMPTAILQSLWILTSFYILSRRVKSSGCPW